MLINIDTYNFEIKTYKIINNLEINDFSMVCLF